jgi:hypothetical protein
MFLQPHVTYSADQFLLYAGRGQNLDQWHVPVYIRIFLVSDGFSCTQILSSDSEAVQSTIHSLIFQESFILVRNCVVRNNIYYFDFISNNLVILLN